MGFQGRHGKLTDGAVRPGRPADSAVHHVSEELPGQKCKEGDTENGMGSPEEPVETKCTYALDSCKLHRSGYGIPDHTPLFKLRHLKGNSCSFEQETTDRNSQEQPNHGGDPPFP